MKRFCLALDLKDDPELIAAYENWHKPENAWPENLQHLRECGITAMDIYRTGNRLFMIMETIDNFSFTQKSDQDAGNPKVQAWELLMSGFQQPLPWARPGEKWVLMDKIFSL